MTTAELILGEDWKTLNLYESTSFTMSNNANRKEVKYLLKKSWMKLTANTLCVHYMCVYYDSLFYLEREPDAVFQNVANFVKKWHNF